MLDSRTLQRSYFVKYLKVSKLKHTAGKTLKRSSKDFSLFGKSMESLLPGKGRWHPPLPAFTFKLLLTVQPLFGYETPLLLVSKDRCKSILNSYLYKTGSLLYKQLYESRERPSEVWSSSFILAPRRSGHFARRNVCASATEIPYWWREFCPESGQELWLVIILIGSNIVLPKVTKVNCKQARKRDKSTTRQSIFLEYILH